MAKKGLSKPPNNKPKITFHYLKGADFRSVHCDGAVGGITPRGLLHVAVFSERHAIPKKTVQELVADNTLGPEIESQRESIGGVVRQMEVDLLMGMDTARTIRDWLTERLKEFDALKASEVRASSSPVAKGKN